MSNEKSLTRREETRLEHLNEAQTTAPLVDIYENKDELLLIADIPGVSKDGIAVHLDKNEMTIEAQRSHLVEGTLLAAEYHPVGYRRSFLIPQGIDAGKIRAEVKNGVLRIHLPKSEALKPRQIQIQAG